MAFTDEGGSLAIAVPFIKATDAGDGTVFVEGLATDDSLDLDNQIIDADFAAKGMEAWFRDWGNVRQMHSSNLAPAGKAVSMEKREGGIWVRAHVVEPTAVKLVQEGVYKAFSVGISRPRIVTDLVAKGGRVVDGIFSEISLVDFPANPSAKFQLAKRAKDGEVEIVEKAIEPDLKKIPTPADIFGKSATDNRENVTDDETKTPESEEVDELTKAKAKADDDADDKDDEKDSDDDGDSDGDDDGDGDDDDSKKSATVDLAKVITDEQMASLEAAIAKALQPQAPAPAAETPELTKGSALYKGVEAIVKAAMEPLEDENKTLRETVETLEKRLTDLEAAPDPGNRAYRGSALGALRPQSQETTAGRGDGAEAQLLQAVVMKARHPDSEISRPGFDQLVTMVGPDQAAKLVLG